MQESDLKRTFAVGFKPADLFFRSLKVMKEMVSSARLIVKINEIQVLATSEDGKAIASLVMEAYTAASWTFGYFALNFDLSTWIQPLLSQVKHQENQFVWIYKIAKSPHVFCLVGNESSPIKLGEAVFIHEVGIHIENLRSRNVTVELESDNLREVISSFASRYDHVMMMAMEDSVTFLTVSGLLQYHTKKGECVIESVEARTAWYLLIEWRGPQILHSASMLSDVVSISSLVDEKWKDWILFSCLGDEWNFFSYMTQGSDTQVLIEQPNMWD